MDCMHPERNVAKVQHTLRDHIVTCGHPVLCVSGVDDSKMLPVSVASFFINGHEAGTSKLARNGHRKCTKLVDAGQQAQSGRDLYGRQILYWAMCLCRHQNRYHMGPKGQRHALISAIMMIRTRLSCDQEHPRRRALAPGLRWL